MTTAPNSASIALSDAPEGAPSGADDYSGATDAAPEGGVVSEWWDGLDQSERKDVVALTATILNTLSGDDETDPPDLCDNAVWCGTGTFDHDGDSATAEIDGVRDYNELQDAAKQTVTQAFHWDMLSGAEMVAAAKAGGLEDFSTYAKAFKDLTHVTEDDTDTTEDERELDQRSLAQTLYQPRVFDHDDDALTTPITHPAVLQRGQGATLTVTAGETARDIGESTITGQGVRFVWQVDSSW